MPYINQEIMDRALSLDRKFYGPIKTFSNLGLVGFLDEYDEQAYDGFEEIETQVKQFLMDNGVLFCYNDDHLIWSEELNPSLQTIFNREYKWQV